MNPRVSIVTSMYRSSNFLKIFVESCDAALKDINCSDFEIILVNDSSPDDSLETALALKRVFYQIKIIDLSRNFGHHNALLAGLEHAVGDYVFLADCDMEVSPTILVQFYEELSQGEWDVVYGFQEQRKGKYVEKKMGGLFWKLFNLLSDVKIPENMVTERLMTRQYVQTLTSLADRNLFLAGMMIWSGFRQKGIPVVKQLRQGKSSYSFSRRFLLMVEAISSFSAHPLKMLFYGGIALTLISFLTGAYYLGQRLIYPEKILTGFTTLVVVVLFSTGMILTALGIIGIYLEKIFNQVRLRPKYVIRKIF